MKKPTVVSLFAGCGGMDLGFEMAGFEVGLASDIWGIALETYKINRKTSNTEIISGDVTKVDVQEKILDYAKNNETTILIGGPPCQDFSSAGKRDGIGHRGNLTPLFAKIASSIKPNWVVMENVNTIKSIGEEQLKECTETLRKSGYGITRVILNAADFGVAQDRKRMFLVCRLGGKDDEMLHHISRFKKERKTVRQFMPEITEGENATEFYYRHARSYERRAIFSIDELSPVIRGVNRPIPKNYKFHKLDATKNRAEVRPLTYEERARIQSFPKGHRWVGGKTNIEQQIGNAVPPLLAHSIAKAIMAFKRNTLEGT